MPQIRLETTALDEIDDSEELLPYQKIKSQTKRKSPGGPKKSSNGGLPKSVLRVVKKHKEKGTRNENRFFQIVEKFRCNISYLISHFDRPTTLEDENLKVDAWCVLHNKKRLKVQIKGSCIRAGIFKEKCKDQNIIIIVVNDHRSDNEILLNFNRLFDAVAKRLKLL